eukprot:SAG11_NODE_8179_length_1051_cov_2.106092_2_plen_59_part_00
MGGAGYCLNEAAARLAAAHDLVAICDEIDYPDDMALGYLLTTRLQVASTPLPSNSRSG